MLSLMIELLRVLGLAIQNHFKAIDLKLGKGGRHSKHRQSLVTLSRRHSMIQMLDHLELDGPSPLRLHHPPNHPLPPPMSASSKVRKLFSVADETEFIEMSLHSSDAT